ncbi:MAG: pimeloyl-ACP methyl ester esterase BioH [Colwellia sp.]|nr:pimeloyl-ACP methyl ester esterase BioH [Colwellia sp.]MCW8866401.1 pimeloyl-ACP methyl ester esterase BioH [Colwellia sp.]MCW9082373.1 pimeloyl-ACP methyl ester esterase BioH [Colwellia sp.]
MAESLHISSYASPIKNSIPLVLIHGWGLNSAVWQPFIAQLSDEFHANFHVVTIDLPGFGENYASQLHPYSLKNIVAEIGKVIEQPAVFLGWSLGGLVATEMALAYPSKVLGLITVSSSPCFLEEMNVEEQQTLWPGIKPNVLRAFHQQLEVDTKKTISGFLKIQAMGSPHIRHDIKQISQLVMQHQMPTKETLDESLCLLESSDYRNKLSDIKQPFLRMYGSNDSLVPKAVIAYVASMARHSDQHIFEQASHAPFISHLHEFNNVLTAWLLEQFSA